MAVVKLSEGGRCLSLGYEVTRRLAPWRLDEAPGQLVDEEGSDQG